MSPGVDRAIRHAIDAAQRYNVELHVFYVVDSEAYSSYPGDEYVHEFKGLETALEQSGQDAIEAITDRAASDGVETQSVIYHGVPHAEILQYVDEANIGLTVVGSKKPARRVPLSAWKCCQPYREHGRKTGHNRQNTDQSVINEIVDCIHGLRFAIGIIHQ